MKFLIANDYLCFTTLLEMIISDLNLNIQFNQTDLAEKFGITIPIGEHTIIKKVKYTENIRECGTKIRVNDINTFFDKHSIPLQVSFIQSNRLEEMTFSDLIASKSKSAYIVFAFCYGVLFDEPRNIDVGHVALFESIDVKNDTIKIYDPGPRNHGSKIVKSDDMLYAMKRRGGLYLFEKVEN